MPMPAVKPWMTPTGTRRRSDPKPKRPVPSCRSPATRPTKARPVRPWVSTICPTRTAIATAGPVTAICEPPNTAATMPPTIAVTMPTVGGTSEASAMATESGSETPATTRPETTS